MKTFHEVKYKIGQNVSVKAETWKELHKSGGPLWAIPSWKPARLPFHRETWAGKLEKQLVTYREMWKGSFLFIEAGGNGEGKPCWITANENGLIEQQLKNNNRKCCVPHITYMSGTVLIASHMSFQSTLTPVNEVDTTHFTAAESKIL